MFRPWLRNAPRSSTAKRQSRRYRPRLETLEGRVVLNHGGLVAVPDIVTIRSDQSVSPNVGSFSEDGFLVRFAIDVLANDTIPHPEFSTFLQGPETDGDLVDPGHGRARVGGFFGDVNGREVFEFSPRDIGSFIGTDRFTYSIRNGVIEAIGEVMIIFEGPPPPPTVQLSVATTSVNETASSVTLLVTRTGDTTGLSSVRYATDSGTARPGEDYEEESGVLNFDSQRNSQEITIRLLEDGAVEGDETFSVTLSNASTGTTIGTVNSTTVTIRDDDSNPATSRFQFSAAAYTFEESAVETFVTITRTGDTSAGASIGIETFNGSALQTVDFNPLLNTVEFAPGAASVAVRVGIREDTASEGTETFGVRIAAPSTGAVGEPSTAVVTIVDNDGSANEQFVANAYLDLLSRPVDDSGRQYWAELLDTGAITRAGFARELTRSDEYARNVVRGLYSGVLGRPADLEALGVLTPQLQVGIFTIETLTAVFLATEELVARNDNDINLYVNNVYRVALGRNADEGGLLFWNSVFQSASAGLMNRGLRTIFTRTLTTSLEGRALLVGGAYLQFLGREADAGGLNAFVGFLGAGGRYQDFVASLVASDEYFRRTTGAAPPV